MHNENAHLTYDVSFTPHGTTSKAKAGFHDLAVARKFANAVNGVVLAPKEAKRSYFAGKLWNALNMGAAVKN